MARVLSGGAVLENSVVKLSGQVRHYPDSSILLLMPKGLVL